MSDLVEDPPGSGLYIPWDLTEVEAGLYASLASATSFTYRGIHIDQSGPFYLQGIEGWASTEGSADDVALSGHGSLLTPVRVSARTVTVSGVCVSESLRDSLFWALRRAAGAGFNENTVTSPLVGEHAGFDLTADAQLVRWQATVAQSRWNRGVFGFDLEFKCPDPKLYGAHVSVSSFLTSPVTGLALPTSLPTAFPAKPVGGQFTTDNTGTALAPAVFTLQGQISSPGVVLNGGTQYQKIISFDSLSDLGVGDTLIIDTARGGSFLNGSYRAPVGGSALTIDMELRPGVNTVSAVGSPGSGSPSVSVVFRPAYW